MERPAHFSHQLYRKARMWPAGVKLAHLTIRDPITMQVKQVSGVVSHDTAERLIDRFVALPEVGQMELELPDRNGEPEDRKPQAA